MPCLGPAVKISHAIFEESPLPDGFEDLAKHNLLTFKSHRESLGGWALCELVGH